MLFTSLLIIASQIRDDEMTIRALVFLENQRDVEILATAISEANTMGITPLLIVGDHTAEDAIEFSGLSRVHVVAHSLEIDQTIFSISNTHRADVVVLPGGGHTNDTHMMTVLRILSNNKIPVVTYSDVAMCDDACFEMKTELGYRMMKLDLRGFASAETFERILHGRRVGNRPIYDDEFDSPGEDRIIEALNDGKRVIMIYAKDGCEIANSVMNSVANLTIAVIDDRICDDDNILNFGHEGDHVRSRRCRMRTLARAAKLASVLITDSCDIFQMYRDLATPTVMLKLKNGWMTKHSLSDTIRLSSLETSSIHACTSSKSPAKMILRSIKKSYST